MNGRDGTGQMKLIPRTEAHGSHWSCELAILAQMSLVMIKV